MKTFDIPFGTIADDTLKNSIPGLSGVMASGQLTEGPNVAEFEKQFAKRFGWKHAIATSSGTDAGIVLWSSLRDIADMRHASLSQHWRQRGVVITPASAFAATANCIIAAGLQPAFVDVDIKTLNMDPAKTEDLIDGNPDRILGIQFVQNMGKPNPISRFREIADKHNLYLVSDSCEAHGSLIDGELADNICDAAIYSLYPAHLVVGVEGGVICTNSDVIADTCRSTKSHGRPFFSTYFAFDRIGFNSKWSELHAVVGLASLANFQSRFNLRRYVRNLLLDKLSRFESDIILYRDDGKEVISPHAFPIVLRSHRHTDSAKTLITHLQSRGIETKTLFGCLPSGHKAFRGSGNRNYPNAEEIGRRGVHFGCGEFMTTQDVDLIATALEEFLARR